MLKLPTNSDFHDLFLKSTAFEASTLSITPPIRTTITFLGAYDIAVYLYIVGKYIIYLYSPRTRTKKFTRGFAFLPVSKNRKHKFYNNNSLLKKVQYMYILQRKHISTFRGYRILFSIRNPYINRFTNHFAIHSYPSYPQKVVLHSITARFYLRSYYSAIWLPFSNLHTCSRVTNWMMTATHCMMGAN